MCRTAEACRQQQRVYLQPAHRPPPHPPAHSPTHPAPIPSHHAVQQAIDFVVGGVCVYGSNCVSNCISESWWPGDELDEACHWHDRCLEASSDRCACHQDLQDIADEVRSERGPAHSFCRRACAAAWASCPATMQYRSNLSVTAGVGPPARTFGRIDRHMAGQLAVQLGPPCLPSNRRAPPPPLLAGAAPPTRRRAAPQS